MHEHEVNCFRIKQKDVSKKAASKQKAIESRQRALKRQEIGLYLLLDRLKQRQTHVDSRLASLEEARSFIAARLEELSATMKKAELLSNTNANERAR